MSKWRSEERERHSKGIGIKVKVRIKVGKERKVATIIRKSKQLTGAAIRCMKIQKEHDLMR